MTAEILRDEQWLVRQHGFDRARANVYETLFTVGNGRLGTRGCLEEGHAGSLSGVFLAGVYDGHDAIVTDLVNAPDWVDTSVHVDGTRLDADTCDIVSHERVLDMSQGVLWRSTVFADRRGRRTRVESLRAACLHDRDVCVLRLTVTPLDHDATVLVSTGLDGDRSNLEALPVYPADRTFSPEERWAKWARSRHLEPVDAGVSDDVLHLVTRTIGTRVEIAYAATAAVSPAPQEVETVHGSRGVTRRSSVSLAAGESVRLDKVVAVGTSRDLDQLSGEMLLEHVRSTVRRATDAGIDALLRANAEAWEDIWNECDAEVVGDPRLAQAVRFSIYHLVITANPDDPTVNIGAKSLSGEGYRGHIFWDTEAMMLPFFVLTQPRTARALLGYRHHTLGGARRNAAEGDRRGARYAWESADTGDEECPRFTPDGSNRFWTRDEEVHVSADVAYGIRRYVEATQDEAFLREKGAEILFETSRFWVDFAEKGDDGHLHLRQVMGPDEFHSHVDDNAFTNRIVAWHLRYAADVHDAMASGAPDELARVAELIELDPGEVATWRRVADAIQPPRRNAEGVVEQFAGYFDRLDVPVTEWDENDMPRYPEGYHHFNCEDTQLLKQPDVIQLMFMLPDEFTERDKEVAFEYYEPRTLHKSSLSPAIHAIMGIEVGDPVRAVQYFTRSALVDLADNQGNTCEGMHIASAAGTWTTLVTGFGGLRVHGTGLDFSPWLPPEWEGIRYRLTWRGLHLRVHVERERLSFEVAGADDATLSVTVQGRDVVLTAGQRTVVDLHPVTA
ncbi:putative Kojibiose phosphorylase [Nostocoides japonicum T1-X7]|uniref:Putative Kojibiose phosphorylase n=1 Tax=Nostocoides japonicum T1-X7 TaxID=1194083 RepID=A0A077M0Q4_9MICO|nr:glycosyl hydrolase family 65 protein [Tetrasphaera japonica]CCH79426.1 putative Kojibiose phosphorylase [Tetrasphaera japonica T1-X7]